MATELALVVTGLGAHGATGADIDGLAATLRDGRELFFQRTDAVTGCSWPSADDSPMTEDYIDLQHNELRRPAATRVARAPT